MFEALIIAGVLYCLLDLIFALILRRCVLPGLKCPACRRALAEMEASDEG